MKNVTNKKLGIASVVFMVIGAILVLLNAWQMKRMPSVEHPAEIHFYNNVIWPIGAVVFLLGLTALLYVISRIAAERLSGK